MAYSCSQCSFTAQFESALLMHHQLHHESPREGDFFGLDSPKILKEKSFTLPRMSPPLSPYSKNKNRGMKLPTRTSSATRLFGKLKAKICKSKMLFVHPEESPDSAFNVLNLTVPSDCTSKAFKTNSMPSRGSAVTTCLEEQKETYACHLCNFDADRITVLDRHLLNDHKIGLENLLKLVMAKTKDGLADDHNSINYGIRQPYYKPQNEIIEEGEFIIETVTPTIKILKHSATNTDETYKTFLGKASSLEDNCKMISKEIEELINGNNNMDSGIFLAKMQTLNDCMCKFVDSSNALKKVLSKEFDSKIDVKKNVNGEPFFALGLGERDTPRDWERAHSEKMERSRNKHGDCRSEKPKMSSESFYF